MLARNVVRHIHDVVIQRAQVGVFHQPWDVHRWIIHVEPEVVGERLLELADHAHYGDVLLSLELSEHIGRQVGHHAGHVGQRDGAYHAVEGIEALGRLDALHRATFHAHAGNGLPEAELATTGLDVSLHGRQEGIGTAFQIPQLFLEDVVAGAADAADAAPDPRSRQIAHMVVELIVEQPAPQYLVGLGTHPATDPRRSLQVIQRLPVIALDRQEGVQRVAELGHEAEARELEQRHRVAPGHHLVLVVVAHLGGHPAHSIGELQLVEHLEECRVGDAVEMVVAFDVEAAEIEGGGHAAHPVIGFKDDRLMSVAGQLVGHRQPHRAGAEHGNALFVHGSELQYDRAVFGVVVGFVDGLCKGRGLDLEDARPIDDFEHIASHQRGELLSGEGRHLVEQRPGGEQRVEQAVGNLDDPAAGLGGLLDLADDVDVVDFLKPGDVVHALGVVLDAADDDAAEIAHVQRLAQVAAVAGNGEHRHLPHEARQPAQVLAVEPAEHQRGAQHHQRETAGERDLFLGLLGVGVPVVSHGFDHRRADLHVVRHLMGAHGLDDVLGRGDVVALELGVVGATDLGLEHHHHFSASKVFLPVAAVGEVDEFGDDVRVHLAQDAQVGDVLVEHHQVGITLALELRDEVLAHQASAAGQDDLHVLVHGCRLGFLQFGIRDDGPALVTCSSCGRCDPGCG